MRTTLRALVFVAMAGCAVAQPGATRRSTDVNALWNDSGTEQRLGFWVYANPGSCPGLFQSSDIPLAFGTQKPQSALAGTIDATELRYCFTIPDRSKMHQRLKCKGGNVQLVYTEASREYAGTYSFVMSDGSKREGTFTAAYCRPGGGDAKSQEKSENQ